MARGFLSGAILGGVIGVGATGVASVLAPLPNPPRVSDTAPQAVTVAAVPVEDVSEARSDADGALSTDQSAAQTVAPDPDTLETLDTAALAPAVQPDAGNAQTALAQPADTSQASSVAVTPDAPVLPTPQALAPMEPQAVDDVTISTEPAARPLPKAIEEATLEDDGPAAPEEDSAGPAQPVTSDAPVAADEQEIVIADAEQPAEMAQDVEAAEGTTPSEADGDTSDTTLTEQVVSVVPDAEVPQPEADAEQAEADQAETAVPQPDQTDAGTEDTQQVAVVQRPQIGTPVGTLTDRETDTGVTIRRPSSNTLGQVDSTEAEAEVVTETAAAAPDSDPRPVKRFSQEFVDPGDKPLMAIVLVDDGSSAVTGAAGIAALRSFPYPLSFAVDASLADAEERMTIYRNEGFEVLAMVDLPEGAVATDAETAFGAILPQLPQIVGVLEGTKGGLQSSREVADQVTSILQQTGHGLVTQARGLNTMPKLARKEGVPADPVFRDFDGKGQNARVIRRFLDQAAFKAGQEGAVVMLGRMRPDTISALLLWGLQDRAGKVALAPVSAVLLRDG